METFGLHGSTCRPTDQSRGRCSFHKATLKNSWPGDFQDYHSNWIRECGILADQHLSHWPFL